MTQDSRWSPDDFFGPSGGPPAAVAPAAAPAPATPTGTTATATTTADPVPAPRFAPGPTLPAAPSTPAPPAPASTAPAPGAPAARQPGAAPSAAPREAGAGRNDAGVLVSLLEHLIESGGSDLHLTAGAPPMVRVRGELTPVADRATLEPEPLQRMIYEIMTQKQRERFEEEVELDFAYSLPGRGRFRVNVYKQRYAVGAAFRLIPWEIKPLDELGVPPAVAAFASLTRGFVLVTGPTGSGKSTTLASLIDLANRTRRDHIMTVEDPIEFLHKHQSCLVNQREVGEDTHSFQNALKHALRQDPDIILVGELRDLDTISVALTAAETGHLVFATLHTQDAPQTVDRVIDVFPAGQQQQIRVQLASALQGVVCQTLCKSADGTRRVVATEVLVATPAVRNLIREGKTHQIHTAMQAGAKFGMLTMDQHLADLVRRGQVSYEVGLEKCHSTEEFARLCGRA